jgi:hypothetical protein
MVAKCAAAVWDRTGLPVWDAVTMTNWLRDALAPSAIT